MNLNPILAQTPGDDVRGHLQHQHQHRPAQQTQQDHEHQVDLNPPDYGVVLPRNRGCWGDLEESEGASGICSWTDGAISD